ncbi:MAG: radical SAM protein [Phycisphaerales bacterium]|nr:radical SAM protein [Phycisphaerales bacterium]
MGSEEKMTLDKAPILGVFPPFWRDEGPHFVLSHFQGLMKSLGADVRILDLNIEASLALKERWGDLSRNCDNIWNEPQDVAGCIEKSGIANLLAKAIAAHQPSWVVFLSVNAARNHATRLLIREVRARFHEKIRIAVNGPLCLGQKDAAAIFPEADLVWSGALESAIPGLMGQCDKGTLHDFSEREYFPDYSGMDMSKYSKPEQLIYTWNFGCRFRCRFCLQGAQYAQEFRRSPLGLSGRLQKLLTDFPTVKYIRFYDGSLNADKNLFHDFLNELDGKNILWGGHLTPMPYLDRSIGERLLSAGCLGVNIGVESGSDSVRKLMGKPNSLDVVEFCIRELHAAGVYVSINLMVGYPGETENDFNETLRFTSRMAEFVSCIVANKTGIYAGTPLFVDAGKLGINLNGDVRHEFLFNYWELADGSNTQTIRQERLLRIESHIESLGLKNARSPDAEDEGTRALKHWRIRNRKGVPSTCAE